MALTRRFDWRSRRFTCPRCKKNYSLCEAVIRREESNLTIDYRRCQTATCRMRYKVVYPIFPG